MKLSPDAGAELLDPLVGMCLISMNEVSGVLGFVGCLGFFFNYYFWLGGLGFLVGFFWCFFFFNFFLQPGKKVTYSSAAFRVESVPLPPPSPQDRSSSLHTCERVDFIANGFCCLALMGLRTEVLPNTEGAAAAPRTRRILCVRVGLALRVYLRSGCEDTFREDGKEGGCALPGVGLA